MEKKQLIGLAVGGGVVLGVVIGAVWHFGVIVEFLRQFVIRMSGREE